MKKILAAVDFSDLSTSVIDQAAMLAQAFGSSVMILHVQVTTPAFLGNDIGPQILPEHIEEEIQRLDNDLKAMAEYLRLKGIEASYELIQGPIAETILDKATQLNADLLIVGAHTHGFIYRAFIGSVSTALIKHTPCPVLVIPQR